MNKIKAVILLAVFSLSACESVSPLRYGEKEYKPQMSAAEMRINENRIEDIEKRARQQTREEMMDTADAIHRANGDSTIIIH